jgi:hypothetical protein
MFTPYQLQRDLIRVREAELARNAARLAVPHPASPGARWSRPLARLHRLLRRRRAALIRPSTVDG